MQKVIHVSLDGENFAVRLGEPFEENPFTYYPLEVEHLSSGMSTDSFGPAESTDTKTILGEYGFAEDLATFYRRIFGRAPKDTRFKWLDCVNPYCGAWYDAKRRDVPVEDAADPDKGPFYTGWQFPHDEETTGEEDEDCPVHDHSTEDGDGRS
jgi:hypothetical protein